MPAYFPGKQVFRDPGFPLFEARDSRFESKIGARFGIESIRERWDAKITLGITGLHEILGRDYGIEEPYWGPGVKVKDRPSFFRGFHWKVVLSVRTLKVIGKTVKGRSDDLQFLY